jgi:hypothetical protein
LLAIAPKNQEMFSWIQLWTSYASLVLLWFYTYLPNSLLQLISCLILLVVSGSFKIILEVCADHCLWNIRKNSGKKGTKSLWTKSLCFALFWGFMIYCTPTQSYVSFFRMRDLAFH